MLLFSSWNGNLAPANKDAGFEVGRKWLDYPVLSCQSVASGNYKGRARGRHWRLRPAGHVAYPSVVYMTSPLWVRTGLVQNSLVTVTFPTRVSNMYPLCTGWVPCLPRVCVPVYETPLPPFSVSGHPTRRKDPTCCLLGVWRLPAEY